MVFLNKAKIICGKHAFNKIPFELKQAGARRPMIITGEITEKTGFTARVCKGFDGDDVEVNAIYVDRAERAEQTAVLKAVQMFYDYDCDSIISVGEASVLAVAKAARLAVAQKVSGISELKDTAIVPAKKIPLFVVACSRPFAYEAVRYAEIYDIKLNIRMLLESEECLPDAVFCDGEAYDMFSLGFLHACYLDILAKAVFSYEKADEMKRCYLKAAIVSAQKSREKLLKKNLSKEGAQWLYVSDALVGVGWEKCDMLFPLVTAIRELTGVSSKIIRTILLRAALKIDSPLLNKSFNALARAFTEDFLSNADSFRQKLDNMLQAYLKTHEKASLAEIGLKFENRAKILEMEEKFQKLIDEKRNSAHNKLIHDLLNEALKSDTGENV